MQRAAWKGLSRHAAASAPKAASTATAAAGAVPRRLIAHTPTCLGGYHPKKSQNFNWKQKAWLANREKELAAEAGFEEQKEVAEEDMLEVDENFLNRLVFEEDTEYEDLVEELKLGAAASAPEVVVEKAGRGKKVKKPRKGRAIRFKSEEWLAMRKRVNVDRLYGN